MASEVLRRVAERMAREPAFRRAVAMNPAEALAAYELTEAEVRSLLPDPDHSDSGSSGPSERPASR